MPNDLDKFLRESGRQSDLDRIRAIPGGFEKAQAEFQAGTGQFAASALTPSPVAETGTILPSVQPTIDLPQLFETSIAETGVGKLEEKLLGMEKSFTERKGEVDDNPFLSEAQRVGRQEKLQRLFDERTANIRGDIARKRADVETKLNLQLKQFDIQSQQARDALSQFNTLLQAGALDNASGEAIANLTRSTGISSSMIQSAIKVSRAAKEKEKERKTQTISFDDGTNQGFAVIDSETGEIIKKQVVAPSKPEKAKGISASDQKIMEQQETFSNVASDVRQGATLKDLAIHYNVPGGLTLEEIYNLYSRSDSPHGPPKETLQQFKQGIFVGDPGFVEERGL